MSRELEGTAEQLAIAETSGFAVVSQQVGLVVEGVDVGGAATHTGEDNALGSGRKMGTTRSGRAGREGLLGGEPGEGQIPETGRDRLEGVSAAEVGQYGFVHRAIFPLLNSKTLLNI